ncbi:AAA family ATPase [Longimicrobium sp.]|uniref:AAA family ATPase n=1 Tax=Longimicrobium sp. TaxID=2029185 RepID=UPI002E3129F0|nr:AAA family ATPase [Longimicrobium sp.]HEX6041208.1 AAA family ATPase [Longimicrobium sp.]
MFFRVLPVGEKPAFSGSAGACLLMDDWNDWFTYQTLFSLVVFDASGQRRDIGSVKIGAFGMTKEQPRPNLPMRFDTLSTRFFSVGQDDSYYEVLNELEPELRDRVLNGLRDLAVADEEFLNRALQEHVTDTSLLRSVSEMTVRRQFRRIARGDARLTKYSIVYQMVGTHEQAEPPLRIQFDVEPESHPPTNIHVLIGRNGVGKTHLMNSMTKALVIPNPEPESGAFITIDDPFGQGEKFAGLVAVSFSAFDTSEPLAAMSPPTTGFRYTYVGLQKTAPEKGPRTPSELTLEIVKSVYNFHKDARLLRWRRALKMLESDPMFADAEIASIPVEGKAAQWTERSFPVFHRLSSGHKIVLLTITKLVETVEERTLVLMDEPEAHLHPPLLSAFVRALSDLLVQRNGVAIIATHSPVVLQEVPRRCVWKLYRAQADMSAERPERETFGENVGVLTSEVFGLEVTQAGFHNMLAESVNKSRSYEAVLGKFNMELGTEARAIVRALVAEEQNGERINE